MSSADDASTDTPSTIGVATPQSGIFEHDTIRVMRPGESVEHHLSTEEPPRLKLKLRNLASKAVNAFAGEIPYATLATPVAESGHLTSIATGKPTGQHEASHEWSHATPSADTPALPVPSTVKPGSVNNPIDLDTYQTLSPHKFRDRPTSYFAPLPLQYRPSRPKLPPKIYTPNGAFIESGVIGGHQSHDIYQMLAARKDVPAPPCSSFATPQIDPAVLKPGRHATAPRTQRKHNYQPVHVQPRHQPRSAYVQQHLPRSHGPYTTFYQTPANGYYVFPKQDETLLRKRSVQYVLDHARPRPRKRRLSDDPDATSGSDYEDASRATKRTRKDTRTPTKTPEVSATSTPSTGVSEENMFDRNLKLTEMVEHAQLMASLLMAYPYSADHKGMREDIAMLAGVTEKRLEAWLSAEDELELETRKRRTSSATAPKPSLHKSPFKGAAPASRARTQSKVLALTEDMIREQRQAQEKRGKEEELRRYLSAESSVWEKQVTKGDGSAYMASYASSGVAPPKTVERQPGHLQVPIQTNTILITERSKARTEKQHPAQLQAPWQPKEIPTTHPPEPRIEERRFVRFRPPFLSRNASVTDLRGISPPPSSMFRHMENTSK